MMHKQKKIWYVKAILKTTVSIYTDQRTQQSIGKSKRKTLCVHVTKPTNIHIKWYGFQNMSHNTSFNSGLFLLPIPWKGGKD